MDEVKKTATNDCMRCKFCVNGRCWHTNWQYHVLRWILALIILGVVFWTGLKIGEFRGSFDYGTFGSRYHSYNNMMGDFRDMPMFGDRYGYGYYRIWDRTQTAPMQGGATTQPSIPTTK